jgi:hypothetical protein
VGLGLDIRRGLSLDVVCPILLPPTSGSGPFFGEPLVRAAAAEDFGTDLDLGGEVKDHGVRAPDRDTIAGQRAKLEQPVFDPNPVQPIGEIADGLRVGEVGLLHPPLGLVSANAPELALTLDNELILAADWLWSNDDPGGWRRCCRITASLDQLSHSEDQLTQAFAASR